MDIIYFETSPKMRNYMEGDNFLDFAKEVVSSFNLSPDYKIGLFSEKIYSYFTPKEYEQYSKFGFIKFEVNFANYERLLTDIDNECFKLDPDNIIIITSDDISSASVASKGAWMNDRVKWISFTGGIDVPFGEKYKYENNTFMKESVETLCGNFLHEEEVNTGASTDPNIVELDTKIATYKNQYNVKKAALDAKTKNDRAELEKLDTLINTLVLQRSQLVKAASMKTDAKDKNANDNGTPGAEGSDRVNDSIHESECTKYSYSKMLFEAVDKSKTEELTNLIKRCFDELDTLSYYMDIKGCEGFAKKLLSWLNEQNWNDGQDHWKDVAERISVIIDKSNASMSTREIDEICSKLGELLKNSNVFGWLFGRENRKRLNF